MIEIRVLVVIGLLAGMALVVAAWVGALAAARWLRRTGVETVRRRSVANAASVARPVLVSSRLTDAERRLRLRQAAWRLRC